MRSFITLGVLSVVGAVAFIGCGDDDGDGGGTAGRGGSAGSAGAAGAAGAGGAGGNGGSAGRGGMGGGGAGGAPTVPAANCTGCVQLSVSVNATPPAGATNNQAGFIFSAPATAEPFDLSEVDTITWRVQALTPNAVYYVQPFLQTAPPEDPAYAFGVYPAQVPLTAAAFPAGTFVDVELDVAAIGGGAVGDAGADAGGEEPAADAGALLTAFDKSKTRTIGLNVGATAGAPAGLVSIEVDSVTVVGTSNFTSKTFTANAEGLALNMYQVPPPPFNPVHIP